MAPVTRFQRVGGRQPSDGNTFGLIGPDDVANCLAERGAIRPWAILEAHFTSSDHPPVGGSSVGHHVPGAIQIHPSYLEAGTDTSRYYPFYNRPPDGNLLPDPELAAALSRLGITPDTPVIVYGVEPDGTMAAARSPGG